MSQLSQAAWKRYFAQLGESGSASYAEVMHHTTTQITRLFIQASQPYSGKLPQQLAQAIYQVDLDNQQADLCDVVTDTVELVAKNSILVQHPHCIAHLHTPPLLSSIAAESIIAALNQSMDSWDQASAATYVEQRVVEWLCERYRLGEQSDGVFTSGGTQSNQMGLLLARDWIADKRSNHSIQKLGLPEYADKLRIICSKNSHFTVQKSASMMGLGERAVVAVDTDDVGRMDIEALRKAVAELKQQGLIPFALVATAGTTDHGAIDDIEAMAEIAEQQSIWLHVDGAYGGALILSSHKARLAGIEKADSVSVDFHKLFYQNISCGAILIKQKSHFAFLRHHADYLNREDDELPNLVDKTIATTKRFDALKVYMTMQHVGPVALGGMYDHLIAQTQQVASLVKAQPQLVLLAEPSLSTVLFRLTHSEQDQQDRLNQRVRMQALTQGIAVLGETVIDGHVALKLTILNPCLTLSDFETLFAKINTLALSLVE